MSQSKPTGGSAATSKLPGQTVDVTSQKLHDQLKQFIAKAPIPKEPRSSTAAIQTVRPQRTDFPTIRSTVTVPRGATGVPARIPRVHLPISSGASKTTLVSTQPSLATMHKNVVIKTTPPRDTVSEVIESVVRDTTGLQQDPIVIAEESVTESGSNNNQLIVTTSAGAGLTAVSTSCSTTTSSIAAITSSLANIIEPVYSVAPQPGDAVETAIDINDNDTDSTKSRQSGRQAIDEISVAEANYLDSIAVDYWKLELQ